MKEFLSKCRYYLFYGFFISMFVNILQLTFSIYMLQVYDRVLTSYSVSTLIVITIAAAICLIVLALLEWIRSRLLIRAGIEFNAILSKDVLFRNLEAASTFQPQSNQGTIKDVQIVRNFLSGNAVFAFFDIPWMPLYFLLIFVLHPALGFVALGGGACVICIGVAAQKMTSGDLQRANALNGTASGFMGAALRNGSAVRSMGMAHSVIRRWSRLNNEVVGLQTRASRKAGLLQSTNKALRMGLQVLIYAVGAYLAITHESTAGIMIAASIIMGRALAPIDQAMSSYRMSLEAKDSYKRLKDTLDKPSPPPPMPLPAPTGAISVENLMFGAPGQPIIKNVSFTLPAGDTLAVIGPSASGKSTLCKLLLGLWKPMAGKVRFDDADIATWDPERLGEHVGYLPQEVELFTGTIAENIARMSEVDSDAVIRAAELAGVHKLILNLPKGYDTPIGERGAALSGGQRQRVGLARALYGEPKIVILDEPNSNLDEEGEGGLIQAIRHLKMRRATVILVTHKPAILGIADKILMMQQGQAAFFGPRQDVLAQLNALQLKQRQLQQQRLEAQKREEAMRRVEYGAM